MAEGEVKVKITADNSDANSKIKETKSEIEETGDKAKSAGDGAFSKLKSGAASAAKTIAKTAAAATTALGAATVALGKQAVDAYADYEQLIGGVETLFGAGGMSIEEYAESVGESVDAVSDEYDSLMSAQDSVVANAEAAWQTCGMSANEYMENATSFAASLVSSLDGDTQAAADAADVAMQDMSDNANKMGTDIDRITDAYQGFAKQNYTMLDNLKLGYGGTKTEMERLISDANELAVAQGEAGDLTIDSYADVVEAIHLVQEEMGITGTTAKEAEETIQGSCSAMKAAWENWLTALATDDMDIGEYTENLIQSVETFVSNVVPVAAEVGQTLVDELPGALSGLAEALWPEIQTAIQEAWDLAVGALGDLTGIELPAFESEEVQGAIDTVKEKVQELQQAYSDFAQSEDVQAVVDAVTGVVEGIQQAFEDFAGSEVVNGALSGIWDTVSDPAGTLDSIKEAAGELKDTLEELSPIIGMVGGGLLAYMAYSAVATVITAIKTAFTALRDATLLEAAAQWLLNAAMNANPVAIIVTLLGALVGAFVAAYLASDEFREDVNTALLKVKTFVAKFVNSVKKFFTESLPKAVQSLIQWFQKLPTKISTAVSNALQSVADFASGVAEKAQKAGKDFLKAIQTKFGEAVEYIKGIPQKAKDALGSLGTKLLQSGKDLIQGLIDGINSKIQAVKDACTGAVNAVTSKVKNLLGIESPSKVFREIGGYIMEGLTEGIEDGAGAAVSAAESAMDGIAATAQSATLTVSKLASAVSGVGSASVGVEFGSALQTVRAAETRQTVVNQTFETKVVRSDADLYTAVPTIVRGALREASYVG